MTKTATTLNIGVAELDNPHRGFHRLGAFFLASIFNVMLIIVPETAWSQQTCPCFQAIGEISALNIAQDYIDLNFGTGPTPWTCVDFKSKGTRTARVFNTDAAVIDRRLLDFRTLQNGLCHIASTEGLGTFTVIFQSPIVKGERAACNKAIKLVCMFVDLDGP